MGSINKLYKNYCALFIAFFIAQVAFGQFTIPEKPELQTSVYDYAKLLSTYQKRTLENKLIKYSDSTSTQIVVATIDSIGGDEISYVGANWAHDWGIGQEKEDNGIFILLAEDERRITIQTGYGIEHLLTDAFSRRIIENVVIPEFKKGDYYLGLDKGTDAIFEVLNGTYINDKPGESSGFPTIIIVLIVFSILMIVFSNKKNGGGNNRRYRKDSTAAAIIEAIILSRAGRGGFGGGGFGGGSSGGFGSGGFGGGGFGGGGASGGW